MRTPASIVPSFVSAAILAAGASAVQAGSPERVFIEYSPGAGAVVREAIAAEDGVIHYRFDRIGALAASLDDRAAERVAQHPKVLSVEPDPKRYLAGKKVSVVDDADPQTLPYGIDRVQAPMVWAEGFEGEGVTVCIIDTGLYVGHEDIDDDHVLGGNVQYNLGEWPYGDWDFDGYGHGTHVAGTVSAADNDVGVVGVSPGKIDLYMVKIFGDDGLWTYASDLVAAAFTCSAEGADIINMSLSGSSGPNAERKAFDALYHEDGILSVAAASNDGTRQRVFPASYDSVISVAATDSDNDVADFSNQNQWVELAAPGVGVLSTVPFVSDSWLQTASDTFNGQPLEFADGESTANGELSDGGMCLPDDPAGDWSGKIVLCERGDASFAEKVTKVMEGSGSAAVIYNNEPGGFLGTLGEAGDWIVALSLSQEDGQSALDDVGHDASARSALREGSGYEAWGGTSMATPHVAGVAALLWSARPDASNIEIRQAMTATALDLGVEGRDIAFGHGLVQAYDALQYLQQSTTPGKGPKNR
jgi:subtilisin family serine protease